MKHNLTLMIISSAALAGCAIVSGIEPIAEPVAAVYGVTAVVANPPTDIDSTAGKVGTTVQGDAAELQGHMDNVGGAVKDGVYETTDHVADWIKPTTPKPPQLIAASYCYHVYQDILCYRRPMPGWETRLAGYQPVTADPPSPAMMQPLPVHALDASQLPATRVANSKPVFKELPKQAEAEKPAGDAATPAAATAASEATHEQLPDPALAPQL